MFRLSVSLPSKGGAISGYVGLRLHEGENTRRRVFDLFVRYLFETSISRGSLRFLFGYLHSTLVIEQALNLLRNQ